MTRKIVFSMFSIENDFALLKKCGFLKSGTFFYVKNLKKTLQQNEKNLDCIKHEEDAIIERNLNR